MTVAIRRWALIGAWSLLSAFWLSGCTHAAAARAGESAESTKLPAQARTPLDELQPPVEKPAPGPEDVPVQPEAARLRDKALEFLGRGQLPQATRFMEAGLKLDPDAALLKRDLVLLLVAQGKVEQARPLLEEVADQAGDDVRIQLLMGQFAQTAGRHAEAARRYRMALLCTNAAPEGVPTNEALLLLATSLYRTDHHQAALEALRHLQSNLDRHGHKLGGSKVLGDIIEYPEKLLMQEGTLLLALHRPNEAVDVLDRAFRRDKSFLPAVRKLIQAYLASDRPARAEPFLLELLDGPLAWRDISWAIESVCRTMDDPRGPERLLAQYERTFGAPNDRALLAVAQASHRLGRTEWAISLLADRAAQSASDPNIRLMMAEWQLLEGRPVGAFAALTSLIADQVESARQVNLLVSREGADVWPASFRPSVAARSAQPAEAFAAHYVAGLIEQARGGDEQAGEQFALARAARPTFVPAYEELGEIADRLGKPADLLRLAELARASSAEEQLVAFLEGWALLIADDAKRAVEPLTTAVKMDGEHAKAHLLLGRAQRGAFRTIEAERSFLKALQLGESEAAGSELVDLYLRRRALFAERADQAGADRSLNSARDVVRKLLSDRPDLPAGLRLLAMVQAASGDTLKAIQTIDRAIAKDPDDVESRIVRVRIQLRQVAEQQRLGRRRFERAREDLRFALDRMPANLDALVLMGEIHTGRRDFVTAAEWLARARQEKPTEDRLTLLHAVALRRAGMPSRAAEVLVDVVGPMSPVGLRLLRAACLAEAGRPDDALDLLQEWKKQRGESWQLLHLGSLDILARTGRLDKAEKLVEELRMTRTDVTAEVWHSAWLGALATAGQWDRLTEEAGGMQDSSTPAEWIDRAERGELTANVLLGLRYPYETIQWRLRHRGVLNADLPAAQAIAWLGLYGRYDQAEDFGLNQVRAWPEGNEAAERLADTLRLTMLEELVRAGRRPRARELYERFTSESPDSFVLRANAALVYDETDPVGVARIVADLRRAIELRPGDPEAANNLGYLWADRGENLAEAEALIRRALAANDQANVRDSLGWVLYKRGRFREAMVELRNAVSGVAGDHAVIYDHLGDAYWRLEMKEAAVAMWAEALDLAEVDAELLGDRLDADTRRVLETAPKKIDRAQRGGTPPVAPVAK